MSLTDQAHETMLDASPPYRRAPSSSRASPQPVDNEILKAERDRLLEQNKALREYNERLADEIYKVLLRGVSLVKN